MKEKKKLKLKKFYLHPVTAFILLTFLVMVLSGIFSLFEMQATYSKINSTTGELETTLVRAGTTIGVRTKEQKIENKIQEILVTNGLSEIYTYGFINEKELESATKSIENVKTFATTFLLIMLVISAIVLFVINMIIDFLKQVIEIL